MAIKQQWVEKWRPDTLDGYVFQNDAQRAQMEKWIAEEEIPTLLMSGPPGCGKTTAARILIKALNIHPMDVLDMNASTDNKVDDVRNKIMQFVSTIPFGNMKVVLFDEADGLTLAAQGALRNVVETYSGHARFIFTCNYPHKIIPALKSRCQSFPIDSLDLTDFTARMAEILITESVDFDLDILDTVVKATYPDMRKCIHVCEQNSINGTLILDETNVDNSNDYQIQAVTLIKAGKLRQARQLICNQIRAEEMEELITWSYRNLDLWGKTPEQQDQAILIIRKAAVNSSLVAVQEINVAAMLVELCQISEGN